jgi:hypothetical protein
MRKFLVFVLLFFSFCSTQAEATQVIHFDLKNGASTKIRSKVSINYQHDIPMCTTSHKGILAIHPVKTGSTDNATMVTIDVTFRGIGVGSTHYTCMIGFEYFLVGSVNVTP